MTDQQHTNVLRLFEQSAGQFARALLEEAAAGDDTHSRPAALPMAQIEDLDHQGHWGTYAAWPARSAERRAVLPECAQLKQRGTLERRACATLHPGLHGVSVVGNRRLLMDSSFGLLAGLVGESNILVRLRI